MITYAHDHACPDHGRKRQHGMIWLHALPTHTPMRPMQLSGEPYKTTGPNAGGLRQIPVRMLGATPGKSRWDLTGCPVDMVCNANGPWTRASGNRSPKRGRRCCLPVCTNLGQVPIGTKFRGSIPFTAGQLVQSFHPRYLSVYASTWHFGTKPLIATLQHSILGPWLTATQAGVAPAGTPRAVQGQGSGKKFQFSASSFSPVCRM